MSVTRRLAFAASVAVTGLAATASTAVAQVGPPGACACPVPAAPVVVAAPERLPTWGFGLHVTSLALAPESAPDQETQFGGGGLQVRYRVTPRWQVEVAVDHVREQLANGGEGDRELHSTTVAALYHLRPYARWDGYLRAGLGGTTETTLAEEPGVARGRVDLGVGLERRFRHLAVAAELRAVGLSPRDPGAEPPPTIEGLAQPAGDSPSVIVEEGLSGGQLTIAGTYYF